MQLLIHRQTLPPMKPSCLAFKSFDTWLETRYVTTMGSGIDISNLSPAECMLFAEQLWEKARAHSEAIPVTAAQQKELDRRLDAMERGDLPTAETWDAVKAWLRSR